MHKLQHIYKRASSGSICYVWFDALHTRIDLVLCGRGEEESVDIAGIIHDRLKQLEKTGNFFDGESELSLLNRTAHLHPMAVGPDLFSMIWQGMDYNRLTAGCFDITVKSDNHDTRTIGAVSLDIAASKVGFARPGIRIDLSGFIKGYALESAGRILRDYHVNDALINLGNSSVMAMGNHPNGRGWKIGIDFPGSEGRGTTLMDECLTTSGNNAASRRHIVSPHSNEFVEGVGGVSVVTRRATDGEALSTALCVASPQQRDEMLSHFDAKIYDL